MKILLSAYIIQSIRKMIICHIQWIICQNLTHLLHDELKEQMELLLFSSTINSNLRLRTKDVILCSIYFLIFFLDFFKTIIIIVIEVLCSSFYSCKVIDFLFYQRVTLCFLSKKVVIREWVNILMNLNTTNQQLFRDLIF